MFGILLANLLTGCSGSPEDQLAGKWVEKDSIWDPRSSHIEFLKDGTISLRQGGRSDTGVWTIKDEGVSVELRFEGRRSEKTSVPIGNVTTARLGESLLSYPDDNGGLVQYVKWSGELSEHVQTGDAYVGTWIEQLGTTTESGVEISTEDILKMREKGDIQKIHLRNDGVLEVISIDRIMGKKRYLGRWVMQPDGALAADARVPIVGGGVRFTARPVSKGEFTATFQRGSLNFVKSLGPDFVVPAALANAATSIEAAQIIAEWPPEKGYLRTIRIPNTEQNDVEFAMANDWGYWLIEGDYLDNECGRQPVFGQSRVGRLFKEKDYKAALTERFGAGESKGRRLQFWKDTPGEYQTWAVTSDGLHAGGVIYTACDASI